AWASLSDEALGQQTSWMWQRNQPMKTFIRSLFLLLALIASLVLIPVGPVTAQTFTVLHTFTAASSTYFTNLDGGAPRGDLPLSRDTLYGTTWSGGRSGWGTVFKVNSDGTD